MKFPFCCLLAAALMLNACQRQTDQTPPAEAGAAHYSVEKNQAQTEAAPPSDEEVRVLLALQDRVAQQPNDSALRRELGQKAIHAEAGIMWTIGRGRLPAGASSNAVARNQAQLAARIDASRWAAYLLEWRKNDYATDYGAIKTQVPGGEVANTSYTDSTCVVLLKTILP